MKKEKQGSELGSIFSSTKLLILRAADREARRRSREAVFPTHGCASHRKRRDATRRKIQNFLYVQRAAPTCGGCWLDNFCQRHYARRGNTLHDHCTPCEHLAVRVSDGWGELPNLILVPISKDAPMRSRIRSCISSIKLCNL